MTLYFAPLEACPEVFLKYAEKLGQRNLVFQDLLAWEDWAYDQLKKPVAGVIVTIPCTPNIMSHRKSHPIYTKQRNVSPNVWFASQNIRNTCGTLALLHLLNNIKDMSAVDRGSILDDMRKKTLKASPLERGTFIEKANQIKELHSIFESQGQSRVPTNDLGDECHYITFVIVDGDLYELDGMLDFPVNHGAAEQSDILKRVEGIVQGMLVPLEPDCISFASIVASIDS